MAIPAALIYWLMFQLYKRVIKPTPGFGQLTGIILLVFILLSLVVFRLFHIPLEARNSMQRLFFYTYLLLSGLSIAHQRYVHQIQRRRLALLLLGGFALGMLFDISMRWVG